MMTPSSHPKAEKSSPATPSSPRRDSLNSDPLESPPFAVPASAQSKSRASGPWRFRFTRGKQRQGYSLLLLLCFSHRAHYPCLCSFRFSAAAYGHAEENPRDLQFSTRPAFFAPRRRKIRAFDFFDTSIEPLFPSFI